MDKTIIHTIYGTFCDNMIITDDGNIPVITYKIVKDYIQGKKGFYNIRWSNDIDHWIIFQVMLDKEVS